MCLKERGKTRKKEERGGREKREGGKKEGRKEDVSINLIAIREL